MPPNNRLIGSPALCKTLEYTRHVMIFFSHLLLMSYSLELNEKNNYALAKRRLDRSTLIVFVFACIASAPVLFIFDVGTTPGFSFLNITYSKEEVSGKLPATSINDSSAQRAARSSNIYNSFSPNFCHILLNYDGTAKYYHAISTLKSIYLMTFGFIVFASTVLLISKFMQFVDDNPLIGRQSVFVNFIEIDNPDVSQKLQRMSVYENLQSRSRRESGRARADYSRKPSCNKVDPLPTTVASSSEPGKRESEPVHYLDSSAVDNINIVRGTLTLQSADKNVEKVGTSKEDIPPIPPAPHGTNDSRYFSSQYRLDEIKATISNTDDQLFAHPGSRRGSHRRNRDAPDMNISLANFLFHCECFRSRGKSIYSVKRSFKMAMAYLIVGDILVACAVVAFYQISDEMSVVTNVIHLKSVFAFYLISVFHVDLRHATWGFTRRSNSCC